MCTGPEAIIASAIIGAGTSIAQTAMAPKPKTPNLGALPKSKVAQASKQANTDTANAIKAAKKRSGVAKPNTLLTGSQGVADEDLNLGGSRLV